jgi:FkbM family methyltransferase
MMSESSASIEFGGWQFPVGEQHLIEWMSHRNRKVHGRLTYQYEKFELAMQHTKGRRRAVDIGAHLGTWGFHLAKHFRQVEAFEPVPLHREFYRRNMAHDDNWTLHECALGQMPGEMTMTLYREHSMAAHIGPSRLGGIKYEGLSTAGEIAVPVKTLDSFGFEDIDLIKIDAEGFELQILKGGQETIERWRPTIIVEQKPGNGSRYGYGDQAALPWLEALGAKMVAHKAGDFVFVWP